MTALSVPPVHTALSMPVSKSMHRSYVLSAQLALTSGPPPPWPVPAALPPAPAEPLTLLLPAVGPVPPEAAPAVLVAPLCIVPAEGDVPPWTVVAPADPPFTTPLIPALFPAGCGSSVEQANE